MPSITCDRRRGPLFTIIAYLALVAQIAVGIAPAAERLAGSMAPHVEAPGTQGHFTHNDAQCVACQARSITGMAAPAREPARVTHLVGSVAIATTESAHSSDVHLHQNSRAPPVVS